MKREERMWVRNCGIDFLACQSPSPEVIDYFKLWGIDLPKVQAYLLKCRKRHAKLRKLLKLTYHK